MPIIYGFHQNQLKRIARVIQNDELSKKNIVMIHQQLLETAEHIETLEKRLSKRHMVEANHIQSLKELKKISSRMEGLVKEFAEQLERFEDDDKEKSRTCLNCGGSGVISTHNDRLDENNDVPCVCCNGTGSPDEGEDEGDEEVVTIGVSSSPEYKKHIETLTKALSEHLDEDFK